LVSSQGLFSNSAIPPTSAPQDFDFANFSYSMADMGGIQSSGSMNYPGLGSISWTPGTRPEDLFTVGMFSDFGFQNLSLNQIGAVTGQPVSQGSLASFPLVQSLTVSQLADAIPGLAQTPLNQAPPIAALARQQGLSGGTVGSVAPFLQGQLGQLGGQLTKFGISQIPGLSSTSLSQLPGIDAAKISDIPGLSQFPLMNPLSILDWFVPFDIGFGMSPCSITADCHERNIDNTASGNLKNMSIPCLGEKQSCAHIEVRRNGPFPTTNIRWISKEQEVSGGSGLGAAICDKEPTGRFPLGPNPKVVLEKIDEAAGEIEFALYFSVYVPLDESDSAHCFGPFPMPFFGKAKEKQWILFGPDTVPKNSPFKSLAQGIGPNAGGAGGRCSPQGSGSNPNQSYGYDPHSEANSSDLVSVVTPSSLNRTETLHKDAAAAFNKMRQDAANAGIDLTVVSGYRSIADQQTLWVNQVNKLGSQAAAAKVSAPPGYSEHHTGYAFDIGVGNNVNLDPSFQGTPAYAWLSKNAKTYGFIQSYTGAPNQGAGNEPWHWRYEGTAAAKAEFSKGSTAAASSGQGNGCNGGSGLEPPSPPVSCDGQPRSFIRPTGGPVTSEFGWRTHPISGTLKFHNGIDFGDGYGTPIRASNCGTVILAERTGGYGNYTCIDHGNNVVTCNAHQSRISVRSGQTVKQGEIIGYVGSTGFSTGPHLHFEFKLRGQFKDPRSYVQGI
jgi:LAS superfamily LD-carboxypeptidase LdcB